jgi:adenine deaminase
MKRHVLAVAVCVAAAALHVSAAAQPGPQSSATTAVHNRPVNRLLIKGAMIIPGTGIPASGPSDILIENGLIARIGTSNQQWPQADAVIDARGKWVMPGIVNTHMHWHDERVGPIPIQ